MKSAMIKFFSVAVAAMLLLNPVAASPIIIGEGTVSIEIAYNGEIETVNGGVQTLVLIKYEVWEKSGGILRNTESGYIAQLGDEIVDFFGESWSTEEIVQLMRHRMSEEERRWLENEKQRKK